MSDATGRRTRRNPVLRAGVPFVALVVIGWAGLSHMLQVCEVLVAMQPGVALCSAQRAQRRLHSQGKTEVQDARRPQTDERLPVAVRRRKGRADLDAEYKARRTGRGAQRYVLVTRVDTSPVLCACSGCRRLSTSTTTKTSLCRVHAAERGRADAGSCDHAKARLANFA